jgi:hypothetical protein
MKLAREETRIVVIGMSFYCKNNFKFKGRNRNRNLNRNPGKKIGTRNGNRNLGKNGMVPQHCDIMSDSALSV